MSFLTAVMTGFGGYGQGKAQKEQLDIQKEQAKSESDYSSQQAEALRQQNEATTRSQAFASKMQLPPNWGTMDDQQRSAYLTTSYWNAVHANAPDVAKQILDVMTYGPLAAERYAQAGLTGARVGLVEAQTKFEQGLPALKEKLLGMVDQNKLDVEAKRLAGQIQIANLNNKSRADISQLAAIYRLAGQQDSDAVKSAIGTYTAQMKVYGIQLNPMNGLLEDASGAGYTAPTAPQVPGIIQNFYGPGQGPPQQGPGVPVDAGGGGGGGGNNQQPPKPMSYDAGQLTHMVADALSHKDINKQALSNNLEALVRNHQADAAQVKQLIFTNHLPPPK